MLCILSTTTRSCLLCSSTWSAWIWKSQKILHVSNSATLCDLCSYYGLPLPSPYCVHSFQYSIFATSSCRHNLYWFWASSERLFAMCNSVVHSITYAAQQKLAHSQSSPSNSSPKVKLALQYDTLNLFVIIPFFILSHLHFLATSVEITWKSPYSPLWRNAPSCLLYFFLYVFFLFFLLLILPNF